MGIGIKNRGTADYVSHGGSPSHQVINNMSARYIERLGRYGNYFRSNGDSYRVSTRQWGRAVSNTAGSSIPVTEKANMVGESEIH